MRARPVKTRRRSVLLRATSVCLSAPLDGAEKMLLSDLCNRLSTRAPVDRSTSGRVACAALTAGCFPSPFLRRARVLPCDAGPSCDNPTPAGRALDGAPPALADPYTSLFAFRRVADPGTAFWRRHLGLAFSAMREADVRPLTLPVAPRSLPECEPRTLARNQNRCHRPLVKEDDFHDPKRLPSTGAPESTRSRDPTGLGEPATDLAALPPTIRLPTLFHLSDALARKG